MSESERIDETSNSEQETSNERLKSVPYWKLFQHADLLDTVMISVAILLSTVSGFAIPLESFLTGRLFNVFISFNAATQLSDVLTNTTTSEMCTLNIVQQLLSNVSNVTDNVFCDVSQQGNVINSASAFVCDPTETLTDEATAHALYLVYLAVGVFVTYFLSQILWAASASRQSSRIRIEFYRATLRHNIGWFETNDTSTIGPLFLRGIENIRAGIGTQAGNFLKDVTIFFVGIVWAFAINWKLALVLLTLFPVVSFLGGLSIMATKKSKEIEESAYLKADSAATEVLSAIRTVLAFGGEEREERRYGKHAKEAEMQAIKGGFVTTIIFGVLFFFGLSMFGVAFWYGGVLLADCEIEGGDVLTVLTLVLYGAFSVGGALPQLGTFISASFSASAVFNIIDDILQGLDFVIEPGQTVAIVGPSGNGKSTLLQLLQHLYTPSCGQVTIDGVAVQELDPDWLHQNVGVVTQEPVMFNANIRENILLANSRATQEEVETATTTANAHSFITDLPDGYDTYVGEGGIQLSGGQKQRIAIARALLRNPQILLLDEATSALDNQSERLVQNALEKASKNRTTIVIAHRLSTIQNADVIVCVKGGQIEESGTHEELVSKQGLYSELVGTQLEGIKSAEGSSKGNNHHFNRQALTVRHSKHKQRHLANFKKYRSCNTSGWLNYSGHNKKDKDTSESAIASEDVSDRNKNKLFYLWTFIKPDWAIALIAVVLYSLIGITYPLIGALLANINTVFSESDRSTIIELSRNISLGFIGLAFAAGFFFFLGSFAVTASGERLTTRLRVSAFKAMLHQTLGWHDEEENTTGSLSTLLSVDANSVKDGTGIQLGNIVLAATSVLMGLAIYFYSSWELSLVMTFAFPLLYISYRLANSLYYNTGSGDGDSLQVSSHIVLETVQYIKTVVSLGAEEYFIKSVQHFLQLHTKNSVKKSLLLAFAIAFTRAALICIYAVGWRLAAFLIMEQRIETFQVFRVMAAVMVTARSVTISLNGAPKSSEAYEAGGRILAMIKSSKILTRQQSGDQKMDVTFGHISGNSVYFHYPRRPEVKVLKELSVSVSPGETLALVGSSGSGKSTIISLIERFYQPTVGTITLDGKDISTLDLRWLRSLIGYVPQEPVLFNATIADNIRYGALFREVNDEEIVEVAKACNIHDFIQSLPQGYSTQVGVGGTFLSGGQKQRIAIARALVRNPKILLLDEATSSLDAESEQAVQETLKKARVGRTSIVVAHRLSTVRDANCIAVMMNGRVVESGTHTSLMTKRGAYYDLVTAQVNS